MVTGHIDSPAVSSIVSPRIDQFIAAQLRDVVVMSVIKETLGEYNIREYACARVINISKHLREILTRDAFDTYTSTVWHPSLFLFIIIFFFNKHRI